MTKVTPVPSLKFFKKVEKIKFYKCQKHYQHEQIHNITPNNHREMKNINTRKVMSTMVKSTKCGQHYRIVTFRNADATPPMVRYRSAYG